MNKLDQTYFKCAEEISELLARIFQQINKKRLPISYFRRNKGFREAIR